MAEKQNKKPKGGRKLIRGVTKKHKYERYIREDRRLENKARKIVSRIKGYKNPAKQLNGLTGDLKDKVVALLR